MLINNSQFNSFLNNVLSFNGYLLYGPDKGQVRYRALKIINTIKSSLNSDLIKVSLEDLENNKFVDLINQKNIFSDKLIINLDLDLVPSLNLGLSFFSDIASSTANYVLLEGGNLKKTNILVKNFSSEKKLACIPCYHDTDSTIRSTIINYSKKFKLKIDNDSISYLSQKLGNNKLLTLQEIKKLSIYGGGENVAYKDVLTSVGDSSLITINKICDNLFNTDKSPYFYDKIIEAGYNNILVIRSLLNHFYFLLNFKETHSDNLKSFIHFTRHEFINKQIQVLNTKKINLIISEIFNLEKKCKLDYSIANLLVKKFLMNYSIS